LQISRATALTTTLAATLSLIIIRPPTSSTLFPYTTLFRSYSSRVSMPASYASRIRFSRADSLFSSFLWAARSSNFCTTAGGRHLDRKSTRLNSSHVSISYAVFCLKKKKNQLQDQAEHHHGQ